MRISRPLSIVFYTLTSLSLLLIPIAANAQGLRLTTSPLPINLIAKPGQTVTTDLRIRNSGNQPETLQVGLMTFTTEGASGEPQLRQRQPGDDYFDWVTFSHDQFTLAPNQWQTVKMTIAVPTDAAFSYYYAATFTRVAEDDPDQNQQAVLVGATATLVLLEIDRPDATRQLSISSFTTDKSWYEFLPVNFSVIVKNTGNVHTIPSGDIFISRSGSQEVISHLAVNQLRGNVLPQSQRQFSASWTEGFPRYSQPSIQDGQQPSPELIWDFSQADQLRFGKYTAQVVLAYDDGTRDVPLEATLDFWVIPWRLILGGLVIGLLTLFGLFTVGKSFLRLFKKDQPLDR